MVNDPLECNTIAHLLTQLMNSTGIQDAISLVPSQKGKDVAEWLRALHNCFDGVQLALYPHGTVYKVWLRTGAYERRKAARRSIQQCIIVRNGIIIKEPLPPLPY